MHRNMHNIDTSGVKNYTKELTGAKKRIPKSKISPKFKRQRNSFMNGVPNNVGMVQVNNINITQDDIAKGLDISFDRN